MTYNDEADRWDAGDREAGYYADYLEASQETPFGKAGPRSGSSDTTKIVAPEDAPWEDTPQGRIKHLLNEHICEEEDIPVRGTDLYMQELPPGEASGKHRHMSEEVLYVLEGEGYDRHWDPDIRPTEDEQFIEWEFDEEPKRFEWEQGDVVFIPTGSVHQHHNASDAAPARFLSMSNRAYNHLGYGYYDLEQIESVDGQ